MKSKMKKGAKTTLIVLGIILAVLIIVNETIAIISKVASDGLLVVAQRVEKVQYDEAVITPELVENG